MEELLGFLLTHEIGMKEQEEDGARHDRRKGVALESKVVEGHEEEKNSDDEEIVKYVRRFKKFLRRKKFG